MSGCFMMQFLIAWSDASFTLTSAPIFSFFLVWGGAALGMNQGRCLLSKGLLGICGRQKVHKEWSWGVMQKVKKSLGENIWWWVTHISQTFTNNSWHLSFIFGFLRDTLSTWLEEILGSTRTKMVRDTMNTESAVWCWGYKEVRNGPKLNGILNDSFMAQFYIS